MTSKTLRYTCNNCNFEHVFCRHCDTWKIATKEFWYSTHEKLKFDKCKECKKQYTNKNRDPNKKYVSKYNKERKKIYNKMYYAKKKMEKLNAEKQL
jgi:hypothetical protein